MVRRVPTSRVSICSQELPQHVQMFCLGLPCPLRWSLSRKCHSGRKPTRRQGKHALARQCGSWQTRALGCVQWTTAFTPQASDCTQGVLALNETMLSRDGRVDPYAPQDHVGLQQRLSSRVRFRPVSAKRLPCSACLSVRRMASLGVSSASGQTLATTGNSDPADTHAWLARLVSFDTTSRNSNLALIETVEAWVESLGVRTTRIPRAFAVRSQHARRSFPRLHRMAKGLLGSVKKSGALCVKFIVRGQARQRRQTEPPEESSLA